MIHGGDIYRNQITNDFSVNINPLGIPKQTKKAMLEAVMHCDQYPDIQAQELVHAIETISGIPLENILCGNGASELFLAIFHGVRPKKTIIPVPSFSGYEYAARAVGSKLVPYVMKEEHGFCLDFDFINSIKRDINMLILANPNNPVGNIIDRKFLEQVVKECMKKNIIVVIDECFMEFTGKEEVYSLKDVLLQYPNLMIVRAFTKLYAVPGIRLGYLFCGNENLLAKIGRQLPEWNLSIPAQAAGKAACREDKYREETVQFLEKERVYLTEKLRQEGITVFPSETNFLLLKSNFLLYEKLLNKGILIRDCSNFKGLQRGFYRIAIKKRDENELLMRAIRDIKGKG